MPSGKSLLAQYNKPLLAIGAGTVSGISKALVVIAGKKLGLLSTDLMQISAAILTQNSIHGLWEYIFGWMVVCIFGALLGLTFYYSLILLGRDYLLFKAIGAGIAAWFINTSCAWFFHIPLTDYSRYTAHLVYFSSAIAFGITLNWMLQKFAFRPT